MLGSSSGQGTQMQNTCPDHLCHEFVSCAGGCSRVWLTLLRVVVGVVDSDPDGAAIWHLSVGSGQPTASRVLQTCSCLVVVARPYGWNSVENGLIHSSRVLQGNQGSDDVCWLRVSDKRFVELGGELIDHGGESCFQGRQHDESDHSNIMASGIVSTISRPNPRFDREP
jgi:hypothetical protein